MEAIDGGYRVPESVPVYAPNELGKDAPFFQLLTLALDVARADEEIIFAGNFIWAYDATDLSTTVSIKFNNQLSQALPFYQGQVIKGQPFSRLFITHAAQAGKSISLLVVQQSGNFSIDNPGATFASVTIAKPTTGASIADVTIVQAAASAVILAADATRRTAIISAPITNTQEIRIGVGNASAAATGIPLQPGESVAIETTVAIYGYTGAGVNQTAAISRTND